MKYLETFEDMKDKVEARVGQLAGLTISIGHLTLFGISRIFRVGIWK